MTIKPVSMGRPWRCSTRIAALHNKCFPSDQKLIIVHTADAHGGFPPSAAAPAVPLWRFIDLHTSWAAVSAGPFFLFRSSDDLSAHEFDTTPLASKPRVVR
ncbi:hypothetical protein CCGE532_31660 (plasmid) [Rhizobium sp. CCGE532]|nr:hypothetical protein CCGE532_31660 [Rhizobium sp. CCGE532]